MSNLLTVLVSTRCIFYADSQNKIDSLKIFSVTMRAYM